MQIKKGYSNLVINYLRKAIDKYDQDHNLKNKKIFICTGIDRRNENRRKEFQIPVEQPQCPIYKDNRCCGSCDYTPTCDYAINCNCYGYAYASLGGTDEDYYMRNSDFYKYGRIGQDGKFDWNFYNENMKKMLLEVGVYTNLKNTSGISNESDVEFVKENEIKYVKIIGDIDTEGNVLVDCSIHNINKQFTANICSLHQYPVEEKTIIYLLGLDKEKKGENHE
jgi:hypothetical protein